MSDRFRKLSPQPKLDHRKPVDTIHPPFHGATAMQGHHYFGSGDTYLFSDAELLKVASAPRPAMPEPTPTKPKLPPVTETFGDETVEVPNDPDPTPESQQGEPEENPAPADTNAAQGAEQNDASNDDNINLVKWATREENYNFMQVKAKASDLFPDTELTDSASIVKAMIDAGMITEDEAKR